LFFVFLIFWKVGLEFFCEFFRCDSRGTKSQAFQTSFFIYYYFFNMIYYYVVRVIHIIALRCSRETLMLLKGSSSAQRATAF
jgi:hypothetical protein